VENNQRRCARRSAKDNLCISAKNRASKACQTPTCYGRPPPNKSAKANAKSTLKIVPQPKFPDYVECAFSQQRTQFLAAFADAIPPAIPPFEGGSDRTHRVRLNFHANHIELLLICLETVIKTWTGDIHFRTHNGRSRTIAHLREEFHRTPFDRLDVRIQETKSDDPKRNLIYFSVIEFGFWDVQKETYKPSPPMICPRGNSILHPMREQTFAGLTQPEPDQGGWPWHHLRDLSDGRDINDCPFEIDVVYTWVDGQDPDWLDSKLAAQAEAAGEAIPESSSRAFLDERFANRDELLFSLRSLELYAPFVRHVYLVTAGQRPAWLAENHPRLTVIDHKDIYTHPDCLPVFNSSSIETQLHRIKGLSEHFLYMNDDFFFGKMCEPSDFFQSNGVAKIPYSDTCLNAADIDDTSEEYIIADKNALALFVDEYGFKASDLLIHSPYPARVSLLKEIETTFANAFEKCERQKFRSKEDLRPIAFMFPHLAYARGMATAANISNRYLALWKQTIKDQLTGVLKTRKYKTFCINDVGIPDARKKTTEKAVQNFLQNYFPRKSSFEK